MNKVSFCIEGEFWSNCQENTKSNNELISLTPTRLKLRIVKTNGKTVNYMILTSEVKPLIFLLLLVFRILGLALNHCSMMHCRYVL